MSQSALKTIAITDRRGVVRSVHARNRPIRATSAPMMAAQMAAPPSNWGGYIVSEPVPYQPSLEAVVSNVTAAGAVLQPG